MTKKFIGINLKRKSPFFKVVRFFISVVLLSTLLLFIATVVKFASSWDGQGVPQLNTQVSQVLSSSDVKNQSNNLLFSVSSFINNLKLPNLDPRVLFSKWFHKTAENVVYTENIANTIILKACIISDIHEDFTNLEKALNLVKSNKCSQLFVIGDLTGYGDIKTLQEVKDNLDASSVPYYVVPGDHDLAQSLGVGNFDQVFGKNYQLVTISGITFMLIDNSPNYTLIDDKQMFWIENNIKSADYVILSQPLYVQGLNPPFNTIYMGSSKTPPTDTSLIEKQSLVEKQGRVLLSLIRDTQNIRGIFAGEQHRSSTLIDPIRKSLTHYVIGAVTSTVDNYPQSAIQTSRFSQLDIYDDKSVSVTDIILE